MTPEDIAKEIVVSIPYIGTGRVSGFNYPHWPLLEMAIAQAIRDAYERAAQVADDIFDPELLHDAYRIASSIRALGEKT